MVAGAARDVVGNVASFAGDVASAAVSAVPKVPGMLGGLGRSTFYEGYGLVVKPTKVTDAVSALSSEDNLALNTWRSASRLTLWGHESRLVADQAPDVAKRVSWVAGIDLDQVKAVGAAHNATVNDVLLGAVSLGLSAYLQERGREVPSETNFLVPISLKPIDMSLPKELGNHFAMVMFPMPLGITEVDALLGEVRSRMARIKNSAEAMMIFGVQRAVAETPQRISQNLTRFVANKSVGLLTNVPGPRAPIYLAGHKVAGILGWVPTSSDQSIGLCIFSYNGHVSIGIATDAGIIPDPDRLEDLIQAGFAGMVAALVDRHVPGDTLAAICPTGFYLTFAIRSSSHSRRMRMDPTRDRPTPSRASARSRTAGRDSRSGTRSGTWSRSATCWWTTPTRGWPPGSQLKGLDPQAADRRGRGVARWPVPDGRVADRHDRHADPAVDRRGPAGGRADPDPPRTARWSPGSSPRTPTTGCCSTATSSTCGCSPR